MAVTDPVMGPASQPAALPQEIQRADPVAPGTPPTVSERIVPIEERTPSLASTSAVQAPAPSRISEWLRWDEEEKADSPPPEIQPQERSDQQLLDSALEFCQAANDYWERGDLDGALDALDQAYALILQVDPNQSPEIFQQRDDLRITISQSIMKIHTSRFTVVNGERKAIPLDMNADVEHALGLLKGPERGFFLRSYQRSGRYRPAIIKALREAGMPEELSWLPLIESGFRNRALSTARALGMWQFIASTGYKYGLKRDNWVDERMDPEKATHAAIAYMKELHQIFGDWMTVLAAYNCGENRVLRVINTQRIDYLDHFWDLYAKLPRETAFYVPKFLAVLHIVNDPEAHGFDLPDVHPEVGSDLVNIDKQVDLKVMARHLDLDPAVLDDLNPELRQGCTPDRPYTVRVPEGKGPTLLAVMDALPSWQPPPPVTRTASASTPGTNQVIHRVQKGETLSSIAQKYKATTAQIMAANNLKKANHIQIGWNLKIPTRSTTAVAASSPASTSTRSPARSVKYTVKRGDSLYKIAQQNNTTVKEIQRVNRLKNTHLSIGQVLEVPVATSATRPVQTLSYTVSRGDTPYLIAQRHRMDLSEFLRMNSLSPRSTIYPGQVLLVRAR